MSLMSSKNKDDETIESKKKPGKSHASEPSKGDFGEYLRGVKTEWTKVTWPTWPQIWGQTIVVIVMVTVISTGILVIDQLISFVTRLLVPQQ